ncbi:MAG: hypothetical protein AAGJ08_20625 [Cyanobacteria bacterium P01_H01_bin.35]
MVFHKLKLNQVFGISPDVPKHTYVERNNLDQKFRYLLDSGSHVVIHGASKQGHFSYQLSVPLAEPSGLT